MRFVPLVVGLLVLSATSLGATASAQPGIEDQAASSETIDVIVLFDSHAAVDRSAITSAGGTVTGGWNVTLVPVLFAQVPRSMLDRIERQAGVVAVQRDLEFSTADQTVPWGVERIDGRAAAGLTNDSVQSSVQVAVIDTGIDQDHPDLEPNLVWGANTVSQDPVVSGLAAADDDNGHGTHVAGTIAARDNDFGVVGVAPSVSLYAIKALGANGTGTESDLIEALEVAVEGPDGTVGTADDADVVSMSLGTDATSPALRAAVEAAAEAAVLVAAVGNEGDGNPDTNEILYPAKYESVIAVAATDTDDRTTAWSGQGDEVEVASPGVGINSTLPDGAYGQLTGTSMAAPHVSGTIALILAKDRAANDTPLSTTDIRTLLHETALDIGPPGRDNESGFGRLQAEAAVHGRTIPITLILSQSTASAGDTVTFRVTRNDTGVPLSHATVTVGNWTVSTDGDGEGAATLRSAGTVRATASATGTAFVHFAPTERTIRVKRHAVGLTIEADPRSANPGEPITFTVTRADTGAPVAATVSVANETLETGSNGTVTRAFATRGTLTATAGKPASDTTSFQPAGVDIAIDRSAIGLVLEANTHAVLAGQTVTYTTTRSDTGEPVNATVTVDGRAHTTGPDGAVDVRIDGTGPVTATATKSGTASASYLPSFVTVNVSRFDVPDVDLDGQPARDPDGDGRYEDVDGDGRLSVVDVQLLFIERRAPAVRQTAPAFDFNGDGRFSVGDIQQLYVWLRDG